MGLLKTSFLFLFLCLGITVQAKVSLPAMFSDNMVLQQKTNAAIWGTAAAGSAITIGTTWSKKTYTTAADNEGNWKIMLQTPTYGGPYTINISDGEELSLKNVLIGEVWLCSGQSNMEMPLAGWGKVKDYQREISEAKYPNIRLLQAIKATANEALSNVKLRGGWEACSPESVADFSSTAYFFARDIYKKTGVPIGLIHTSWGGTIAEAWISSSTMKTAPVQADGPNRPTVLYNAMIHPFIQYAIRGAIWYQGESNAGKANEYRTIFPSLITDWRTKWNIGDFPFYFVQLANYKASLPEPAASTWAELRDAQLQTLSLPNTGMAVTLDIGEEKDIHPKNKQEVGHRLALIALAKNYGQKNAYSGPQVTGQRVNGNTVVLSFKYTDGGLKTKDGAPLKGFAVAGSDQKFYWADAVIKGNKVVLSAEAVPNPVAVRYAWADNPVANLYNEDGLPASAFRTDNWKDTTAGK